VATASALHACEAVLESAAAQMPFELRMHERRQRGAPLPQRPIERLELLFHDRVEHRLLGTLANIARERREHGTPARARRGGLGNSHPSDCSATSARANRCMGVPACRSFIECSPIKCSPDDGRIPELSSIIRGLGPDSGCFSRPERRNGPETPWDRRRGAIRRRQTRHHRGMDVLQAALGAGHG